MKIIINGHECMTLGNVKNVDTLKQTLLELIDIKYSPLEALKANMKTFFDLVLTFCKEEKKNEKGAKKAKLTREITGINSQQRYWQMISSKDVFVKKYYDFMMSLESCPSLRGFGISNAFGDKLKGNPEIQRMSFKRDD